MTSMLPEGHHIEVRDGSFHELLPLDDVKWAYGAVQPCENDPASGSLQGATAIPPDRRDRHLFYRDETGTLQGVLTYAPQGFCDLRWMHSRARGVGSRLFDEFVARAGQGIITSHVIARCDSRQKVEYLLRKHGFLQSEDDPDDWARNPQ